MARLSERTEAPGTERGRSPSGAPGAGGDLGCWSSRRKTEAVLRLLQGEDLDAVSRSLKMSTSRLSQWRAGSTGTGARRPTSSASGRVPAAARHTERPCASPSSAPRAA